MLTELEAMKRERASKVHGCLFILVVGQRMTPTAKNLCHIVLYIVISSRSLTYCHPEASVAKDDGGSRPKLRAESAATVGKTAQNDDSNQTPPEAEDRVAAPRSKLLGDRNGIMQHRQGGTAMATIGNSSMGTSRVPHAACATWQSRLLLHLSRRRGQRQH